MAAPAPEDVATLVKGYLEQADKRLSKGDAEGAEELAKKAVELWENAGNKPQQAFALRRLADVCFKSGNSFDGWQYAKEALHLYRDVADQRGEAEMLYQIALAHVDTETYEEAIRIAEEGIAMCRENGDGAMLGRLLYAVAKAYMTELAGGVASEIQEQQLNWKTRLAGKEALAIFKQVGDRRGEAQALDVLSEAFLTYGNLVEAKLKAKAAAEIFKELGDKKGEGESLLLVARSRVHDNKEEALRLAKLGERLIRKAGDAKLAKQAVETVDKLRDFEPYRKPEKKEEKAATAASQTEKTDITLDFEAMTLRGAYFYGFTSRAARSRSM